MELGAEDKSAGGRSPCTIFTLHAFKPDVRGRARNVVSALWLVLVYQTSTDVSLSLSCKGSSPRRGPVSRCPPLHRCQSLMQFLLLSAISSAIPSGQLLITYIMHVQWPAVLVRCSIVVVGQITCSIAPPAPRYSGFALRFELPQLPRKWRHAASRPASFAADRNSNLNIKTSFEFLTYS